MQAIDKNGRSLEDVVKSLLDDSDFKEVDDQDTIIRAKVQRIRGEMRKYLNRPRIYEEQITYLKGVITDLESQLV